METPAILRQPDGTILVVYSDHVVVVEPDGSTRTEPIERARSADLLAQVAEHRLH